MFLYSQVFEPYFTVRCTKNYKCLRLFKITNWINEENNRSFYHWKQIKPIKIVLILPQINYKVF